MASGSMAEAHSRATKRLDNDSCARGMIAQAALHYFNLWHHGTRWFTASL